MRVVKSHVRVVKSLKCAHEAGHGQNGGFNENGGGFVDEEASYDSLLTLYRLVFLEMINSHMRVVKSHMRVVKRLKCDLGAGHGQNGGFSENGGGFVDEEASYGSSSHARDSLLSRCVERL